MALVRTVHELTLEQRLACEAERRRRLGEYIPREERRAAFQARYRFDPAGFLRDCIDWERMVGRRNRRGLSIPVGPTTYQLQIADDMAEVDREAVKAARGVGKTNIAAGLLLHHAEVWDGYTDWKVISSASIWRQLSDFFWPEVHKLARFLRWDILGRPPYQLGDELMKMGLTLSTGQALANASNKPDTMEGGHASQLFYIFDEAKIIPEATWDAVVDERDGGHIRTKSAAHVDRHPGELAWESRRCPCLPALVGRLNPCQWNHGIRVERAKLGQDLHAEQL